METYLRSGKKVQYVGLAALVLFLFIFGFIQISQQLSEMEIFLFDHKVISLVQSAITPQLTG